MLKIYNNSMLSPGKNSGLTFDKFKQFYEENNELLTNTYPHLFSHLTGSVGQNITLGE